MKAGPQADRRKNFIRHGTYSFSMKDALEAYLSALSFSAQGKYEEALLSFEHSLSLEP